MAYSPSDWKRCKTRVDSLVDAFLAELDCDANRFEALCTEFSEATQEMQEQLAGQAERHAELSAEVHALYEQGVSPYDTYMTGFMFALSERRSRLGMGDPV